MKNLWVPIMVVACMLGMLVLGLQHNKPAPTSAFIALEHPVHRPAPQPVGKTREMCFDGCAILGRGVDPRLGPYLAFVCPGALIIVPAPEAGA